MKRETIEYQTASESVAHSVYPGIELIYNDIHTSEFRLDRPDEDSIFEISHCREGRVEFSFGGGYAAMPLIQDQVVTAHGWLSMPEFTDLITISQMTPGPIAVNSATFVGIKIAGIPGALVATGGCILPSCVIVTLIAKLYLKYRNMAMLQGVLNSLRPAVVAMIASAGISILLTAFWGSGAAISLLGTNWVLVAIFAVCLVLLQKFKMNPIWVMVLAGVLKVLAALVTGA